MLSYFDSKITKVETHFISLFAEKISDLEIRIEIRILLFFIIYIKTLFRIFYLINFPI